jgi:hypothetical protein
VWSADGKEIYFTADERATEPIFAVNVARGQVWERGRMGYTA